MGNRKVNDALKGIVRCTMSYTHPTTNIRVLDIFLEHDRNAYRLYDANIRIDKGEKVRIFTYYRETGPNDEIGIIEILDEENRPKFTYAQSIDLLVIDESDERAKGIREFE